FSSASTARAIRSRAPLRSSSWSGSLTSGVGDETASRVESVMAYPFLLVVNVLVINQQDTPLFQIAPYTRNEHSSVSAGRWLRLRLPTTGRGRSTAGGAQRDAAPAGRICPDRPGPCWQGSFRSRAGGRAINLPSASVAQMQSGGPSGRPWRPCRRRFAAAC